MRHQRAEHHSSIYATAIAARRAGINVLPVKGDGSKRPALDGWRIYQQRRVTPREVERWFRSSACGIAVVTGEISGNLEALDIDSPETYRSWLLRLQQAEHKHISPLCTRIASGYLEATPDGGRHLLYRCTAVEHSRTLARRTDPATEFRQYQTLIETRGTGGLLIIAPSSGNVHPNGRPYTLLRGGVGSIAVITPEERAHLLAFASTFDESPTEIREKRAPYHVAVDQSSISPSSRPGDIFNQQATWEEILKPHGWKLVRIIDGSAQWRRPGKRGPGISATTNYRDYDLLYVFSTATIFEPMRGYSKFAAYTLLEHGGNFSEAARALLQQGYV